MNDSQQPPPKLLRERDILKLLPVHRATLRRWMTDGFFPAGTLLRPGVRVWIEAHVADFIYRSLR